jgi:pimeloyl-ACP methyl ester carboxylesterase
MKTKFFTFIILGLIVQVSTSQVKGVSKSNVVGFSSRIEVDNSRPSTHDGDFGRIIQINIWYPAKMEQKAVKMFFSDYIGIRNNEMGVTGTNQNYEKTFEDYFQWPISQGANQSLIDSIISTKLPMKAEKNIAIKSGKHPVILLMHGSAVDFAFLGESMAEQGYIAINVPVKGYRQKELDVNGIGMETEIRDYEFALSVLSNNSSLDLTNVIALGFSFGGQSALGLACRNPNIKTVISYDGGIGDRFGARLINESSFCSTENVSASILHIYDASYKRAYLDKIRSFIYAERTLIGLNRIAHWHFTSFGYLASKIPSLFGENEFTPNGYKTILEITEEYLHSKSKNPNAPYNLPKDEFNLINKVEHLEPLKTK